MPVGDLTRLIFTVVSVDESGGGMATDGSTFDNELVEVAFERQIPGSLRVGDKISGVQRGDAVIRDVVIESGRNAVRETS